MIRLADIAPCFTSRRSKFPLCAEIDDAGFVQATDAGIIRIGWEEISSVLAHKKDCFVVDQIRVIVFGAGGSFIEMSEEEQDMAELANLIAQHLPNSLSGWHGRLVCSPAFDPTIVSIYPARRAASPSEI